MEGSHEAPPASLNGSTTWVEHNGTNMVRTPWDRRANLREVELDGPKGHLELLTLRLYNPQAHQWSINIASSPAGALSPPAIGEFKSGRGEFYDQETFNGRTILVRPGVSEMIPNSCRFDQAFSPDGGNRSDDVPVFYKFLNFTLSSFRSPQPTSERGGARDVSCEM